MAQEVMKNHTTEPGGNKRLAHLPPNKGQSSSQSPVKWSFHGTSNFTGSHIKLCWGFLLA
jgi:hypothetical protein